MCAGAGEVWRRKRRVDDFFDYSISKKPSLKLVAPLLLHLRLGLLLTFYYFREAINVIVIAISLLLLLHRC